MTVSNLTSIISSLDVSESKTQAYLTNLHEFSQRVGLPEETKQKVKKFIEANSRNSDNSEYQDSLLKDLPSSIRTEIITHTHGEIIRKIIFFRDKDISFLWKILPMLRPLRVLTDDIIFNQEEKAKEMYFILKGRIKLWYNLASKRMQAPILKGFNQYVEGSYFGDLDLFLGVHDSTAIPTTEVNLLVLSKVNCKKLLERYPKEMRSFKDLAMKRRHNHQELIIRSLQKDSDAYKIFKTSQKQDDVDVKAPVQYIVKRLRTHLELKGELSRFEEKIQRLISRSEVGETDSEEGLEIDETSSEEESSKESSESSQSSSGSSQSSDEQSEGKINDNSEKDKVPKTVEKVENKSSRETSKKGGQSLKTTEKAKGARRGSDIFNTLLKNRLSNLNAKVKEEQKKKQELENKIKKEKEHLETQKVAPVSDLPIPSTESKLAKNYDVIKEIIGLIQEENNALNEAVESIYNHNRFIRDKAIDNERKLKQLLSLV
eukprot:CAMPEP_0168355470 /NCGR_PEP_ID=MMETSP0213-20121227/24570_1 /TAXON_ID=151035 /ORGANISM="Euplotes harpa, Strain FSP1.4" /LENGTH=487 /DNA_ID=CAMNT_0008367687 /DNA_START=1477 /DNA_END=2940 /DNA_ORIENTATION=+